SMSKFNPRATRLQLTPRARRSYRSQLQLPVDSAWLSKQKALALCALAEFEPHRTSCWILRICRTWRRGSQAFFRRAGRFRPRLRLTPVPESLQARGRATVWRPDLARLVPE